MSISPRRLALFAVACSLILSVLPVFGYKTGQFEVVFLDVGQGDCEILRCPDGRTVMIDAGDDRFNVTANAIIPYLKKAGITKLDHVVLSHPHRDHFGGMIDLVGRVPIGEILYSEDFFNNGDPESGSGDAALYGRMLQMIQEQQIPYRKMKTGQKLNWGSGLEVTVLHAADVEVEGLVRGPDHLLWPAGTDFSTGVPRAVVASADPNLPKINANDLSAIISVKHGKNTFLFTGDAESKAELKTLERYGDRLKADVLKSGHHGSRTSSGRPMMEKVAPKYGVISVGAKNSFGHPNQEILDLYQYYKMIVYRTDKDGTVRCLSDGQNLSFSANTSPLTLAESPKVIAMTGNSATIQWTTNVPAKTEIRWGAGNLAEAKALDHATTNHVITITDLKPSTRYTFQAVSRDPRNPAIYVAANGEFTTPASTETAPKITALVPQAQSIVVRHPFSLAIRTQNPSSKSLPTRLIVYHSAIAATNVLADIDPLSLAPGANQTVVTPTIDWVGPVELHAVLYRSGKIIDTAAIQIDVQPIIMLIDAAHGNIDYHTGRFAGLKIDVSRQLGVTCHSISKPITATLLADAAVVLIPEPTKEFAAAEIAALKDFVAQGGSVFLFSRADYNNRSRPELLNPILAALGSGMRFNDDEVCDPTNNIGPPYAFFGTQFPSKAIKDVQKLLCRSCCSLTNAKGKALVATPHLQLFATGDDDTYNIDADGQGDAYFYASDSARVVYSAGEDIGAGRVACLGETLYDDKLYGESKTQHAVQFNRSVIAWLAQARFRTLHELLAHLEDTASAGLAPEIAADRVNSLRDRCEKLVNQYLADDRVAEIADAFASVSGGQSKAVRETVVQQLRFREVHGEASPAALDLLVKLGGARP